MRVLIIGCGYIGLALGAELARRGHQVTGVRRTWSGEQAQLKRTGVEPVTAEVTKAESLRGLPRDYEWVVNCVSTTGGGVKEYEQVYREGTRHLLSWMSGFWPLKLVYTSSTSVYGQTDGSWVDETSPTSPASETSQVLLQTEGELLDAAKQGFPAVLLRIAGIYGPGRDFWLRQVRSAHPESASERILNMIHRDDVVAAICAALERGKAGQVYNAVDNEPVSQGVFLKWLSSRLKATPPAAAAAGGGGSKKRGLTNKRVSNRKLREELAFQLEFPTFREGYTRLLETEFSEGANLTRL